MTSYDNNDQMLIVVATVVLYNLVEYMIERIKDLSRMKITSIMMMMQRVTIRKTSTIYMTRR
jgi:hypothetical protein